MKEYDISIPQGIWKVTEPQFVGIQSSSLLDKNSDLVLKTEVPSALP